MLLAIFFAIAYHLFVLQASILIQLGNFLLAGMTFLVPEGAI